MKSFLLKAVDICGSQTALAVAIGVQQPHVWNWIHRSNGVVPVEHCTAIEQATNGLVTRENLREDWKKHWPELARRNRKAKNPPAEQSALPAA